MDDSTRLARDVHNLKRAVASIGRAQQVSRSTVEVDGATVRVPDALAQGVGAGQKAQEALDKAEDAIADAAEATATADGKNRVTASNAEPTYPNPAQGDLWYVLDSEDRVTGVRVWNGTEWVAYSLVADQILVPGSVGGILIGDGQITGPKIAAETITAENIAADALQVARLDVGRFGDNLAPPVESGSVWWTGNGSTLTYGTDGGEPYARVTAPSSGSIPPGGLFGDVSVPRLATGPGTVFQIGAYVRYTGTVPANARFVGTARMSYEDTSQSESRTWFFLPETPTDWFYIEFEIAITQPDFTKDLRLIFKPEAAFGWSFDIKEIIVRRSNERTFINDTLLSTHELNTTRFHATTVRVDGIVVAKDQLRGNSLFADDWMWVANDVTVGGNIKGRGRIGLSDGIGVNPEYTYITLPEWKKLKASVEDTGWVDLSAYIASGFSGTLEGKRVGPTVEVRANLSGQIGPGNVVVARDIPSEWSPTGVTTRGNAYVSGGYPGAAYLNVAGGMTLAAGYDVSSSNGCGLTFRFFGD